MSGERDALGRPGLRRLPDGTPGYRDADNQCEFFATKLGQVDGLGVPIPVLSECNGDSHYLCRECISFSGSPEVANGG